jgi:hypothetical protein
MLTLLVLVALTVAPGTLAVPTFRGEVDPAVRAQVAAQVSEGLASRHYTVVGPARVDEVLTEAQRAQLATCMSPACLASFSGLLAADSLVLGVVTQVGAAFEFDVKVVRGADAAVVAVAKGRAGSRDELELVTGELARALVVSFEASAAPPEPPPPPTLGVPFWAPVIAGAVVAGFGAYAFGTAMVSLDQTRADKVLLAQDPLASAAAIDRGVRQRNAGIFGMSAGVLSILGGVIFGRPTPTKPAVSIVGAVVPGGGGVVVEGRF